MLPNMCRSGSLLSIFAQRGERQTLSVGAMVDPESGATKRVWRQNEWSLDTRCTAGSEELSNFARCKHAFPHNLRLQAIQEHGGEGSVLAGRAENSMHARMSAREGHFWSPCRTWCSRRVAVTRRSRAGATGWHQLCVEPNSSVREVCREASKLDNSEAGGGASPVNVVS